MRMCKRVYICANANIYAVEAQTRLYMCACAHVCIFYTYMVLRRNQICQNDIFSRSGQRTRRDSNVCMSTNKKRLVLANAFLKIKLRSILYDVCATAVGGFAARFLSFRGNYI